MQPLSDAEARAFLEAAPGAHIGIIADGEPYVTPMSFVVDRNRILLRTKPGRRLEAIKANPAVSIEASSYDDETGWWSSVIIRGKAFVTTDKETTQVTVEGLLRKYEKVLGSPLSRGVMQPIASFPHVLEVEIEEITGMTSGGPFGPWTRPGRL